MPKFLADIILFVSQMPPQGYFSHGPSFSAYVDASNDAIGVSNLDGSATFNIQFSDETYGLNIICKEMLAIWTLVTSIK